MQCWCPSSPKLCCLCSCVCLHSSLIILLTKTVHFAFGPVPATHLCYRYLHSTAWPRGRQPGALPGVQWFGASLRCRVSGTIRHMAPCAAVAPSSAKHATCLVSAAVLRLQAQPTRQQSSVLPSGNEDCPTWRSAAQSVCCSCGTTQYSY